MSCRTNRFEFRERVYSLCSSMALHCAFKEPTMVAQAGVFHERKLHIPLESLPPSHVEQVRNLFPYSSILDKDSHSSSSLQTTFDKMLSNVSSSLFLFVIISAVVCGSAQASSYTVLIPCGDNTDNTHPIVPDATCQKISSTGAFTVAQLGELEGNTKIGFSATPDCKQTYTTDELGELQESQECRGYVTVQHDANGAKTDDKKKDDVPDQPPKDDTKDDIPNQLPKDDKKDDAPNQLPKDDKKDEQSKERSLVKRVVGGFSFKRRDSQKPAKDTPMEEEAKTPLAYVMLVTA